MRTRVLVGVVAMSALAVTSASASGDVICVPALVSGCSSSQPTLPAAVTAANTHAGVDTIQLAAGHFDVATGVAALGPVHIVGAGMNQTVIDGTSTAGTYTLTVDGSDSTVTDLTVHGTATGHDTALYLDAATAQRVRVDQRDNSGDPWAVGAQVRNGAAFLDGEALTRMDSSGGLPEGILVDAGAGQTGHVANSLVQGWDALYTSGAGAVVVSGCHVVGQGHAVYAYDGTTTTVEDSILKGGPLTASSQGGLDVSLLIRHDTLDTARIEARGDSATGSAHAVVSNTALIGGGPEFTQFLVNTAGTGAARIDVDHSFYAGADRVDQTQYPGPNNIFDDGGHNVFGADARLLDVVHGDLRPRFDSPLVDAGDPVVADGEPGIDLAGEPRTANGVTDIGAYEYGRHTPAVSASASPSAARTGDTVTFTANTSDADPSEIPAVTWTFDDGSPPISGLIVTHTFATAGPHTAIATATDPAGLTATAAASVAVTTPFVRRAMAPGFLFKRLKARGGVVRVRLRCPVTATDCTGRLELRKRSVLLGRARYAIARGTSKTIRVRLKKGARKRLRRARHGLRVRVVARPAGAASKSKTVRLTGR